ncbi:MAG: helix-turn-helix domain-containing protein [Phycisphaerae bacterium]
MSAEQKLLTRAEAARYLDVKPQTLACWASTKRYGLAYLKIGGSVRYRRVDLDRWLNSRIIGPVADSE